MLRLFLSGDLFFVDLKGQSFPTDDPWSPCIHISSVLIHHAQNDTDKKPATLLAGGSAGSPPSHLPQSPRCIDWGRSAITCAGGRIRTRMLLGHMVLGHACLPLHHSCSFGAWMGTPPASRAIPPPHTAKKLAVDFCSSGYSFRNSAPQGGFGQSRCPGGSSQSRQPALSQRDLSPRSPSRAWRGACAPSWTRTSSLLFKRQLL
jgi:hypothetical protein